MRKSFLSILTGIVAAASLPVYAQIAPNPGSTLPSNFQTIKQGEYNRLAEPEVIFEHFYDLEVEKFYHDDALRLDPTLVYPGPVVDKDICRDGGFELGLDPTLWEGGHGYIDQSGNIDYPNFAKGIFGGPINLSTSHQTLVTRTLDPKVPIFTTSSTASTQAVRIGNVVSGGGAELLSKTFVVTSAQSLITFWYALVLEEPGHATALQPAFRVRILNSGGTDISAGLVNLGNGKNIAIADVTNPYFKKKTGGGTTIVYRDWSCAQINLSSQIGQRVTVQFVTNDCALTGHWGYAYIDDFCGNCDSNSYNLNLEDKDCDSSKFCFKYKLPKSGGTTGNVNITLNLYQNGIQVATQSSGVLSSDSIFCFTITPANYALLNPALGGFDIAAVGNFTIGGGSLAPIFVFTPPDGAVTGMNNDCELKLGPQCCPGTNLVINGYFEQGYSGYASDYTSNKKAPVPGGVIPGYYSLLTDAQAATVSTTWTPICSTQSRHMVINGHTGAIGWSSIWRQAIPVTKGRTYKFCADFKNLPQCGFDIKPKVHVQINQVGYTGSPTSGQTINTGPGSCNWTTIQQTFLATSNGFAYINIFLDETGRGDGNDLAVDNINFIELPSIASSLHFSKTPFNITSTTYNMSITPLAPLSSDCEHFWQVEEVDANSIVIPGTTVTNPIQWSSLSTNTYIGYVGTSTLSGSAHGLFYHDKHYRFAYGRRCKCSASGTRYEIYGPAPSGMNIGSDNNGPQLLQIGILDEQNQPVPLEDFTIPAKNGVKVYPNPTTSKITIEKPVTAESYRLKIVNGYGQVIRKVHLGATETRMELSLSDQAPGAYQLQIVSEHGKVVYNQTITKL